MGEGKRGEREGKGRKRKGEIGSKEEWRKGGGGIRREKSARN